MTREQLEAAIADLKRKLKARDRAGGGYTQNLAAIQARIDELEAELEQLG